MEIEFMVKGFVQHGKTIGTVNAGGVEVLSGSPVMVRRVVAIVTTDVAAGRTGGGFIEGVSLLSRLTADAIAIGEQVHIKDRKMQSDVTGADLVRAAWEDTTTSSTIVVVKANA